MNHIVLYMQTIFLIHLVNINNLVNILNQRWLWNFFSIFLDYRFISYSQIDLRLFYLFHLNTENMQQFSEKTYKLDEKPTWLRYENFRLHSHYGAFVFNSAEQCNKECFRDLNCYANTFSQNPSLQYARNICYFYNNTNSFLYGI
jgi:hypothetical protein